jgi:hypothetical protein
MKNTERIDYQNELFEIACVLNKQRNILLALDDELDTFSTFVDKFEKSATHNNELALSAQAARDFPRWKALLCVGIEILDSEVSPVVVEAGLTEGGK